MADGSESFVCVVHSRRYVYIQQLWYSSGVCVRIATLLAVVHQTSSSALVVGIHRDMVGLMAAWFFSRAHIFYREAYCATRARRY